MPRHLKATNEQITESYGRLQNVWLVAEEFGMCGQSVHERVVKLGVVNQMNIFSEADVARLRAEYEGHVNNGTLHVLAASMGRTRQFLARQARKISLTDRARAKPYLVGVTGPKMREWHANNNHPRGMLGKTHTDENKAASSKRFQELWNNRTPKQRADFTLKAMKAKLAKYGTLCTERPHTTWKSAWREIGGRHKYFRSKWEANYARYLNWLEQRGAIKLWEHEPETFWFEKIRRGTRSYLPDFRVTERSGAIVYHEVKGWMDARSKVKLKRMKKYHPTVKLILIDSKAYYSISKKVGRLIEGWE